MGRQPQVILALPSGCLLCLLACPGSPVLVPGVSVTWGFLECRGQDELPYAIIVSNDGQIAVGLPILGHLQMIHAI